MPQININLEDVDDGSEPIPEGAHLCRVKSCELKHKQGSEYPYLDVRMNPLDVEGMEKRVLRLTLSYHPDALWNMKRFNKAAGLPMSDFATEDYIGREIVVSVGIVPNPDDPEQKRNEVKPPYQRAA